MKHEEDSLHVVGKLPRHDKDGNEITKDSLGSGGARRENGTVSALVFDLKTLPEDTDTSRAGPKLSTEQQIDLFMRALEIAVPVAQKAAPHVRTWWVERAAPASRERLRRVTQRLRPLNEKADGQGPTTDPVDSLAASSSTSSMDAEPAIAQPKVNMSSAEWQKGFSAWMAATAVEECLRRILANALIDDETLIELQDATKRLTPEQRAVIATRVLEISPSSLDDKAFTRLVNLFGDARFVEGQHWPGTLEGT